MKLLARASAGLWLWTLAFSLLYALHGIGCARGWDGVPLLGGSLFRWTMVATWLVFALCGAASVLWARRAPTGLERQLTVTCSIVGAVGIVVVGSPTALISACL